MIILDDGVFPDETSDILNNICSQTDLEQYYIIEKIADKLNGNNNNCHVIQSVAIILAEELKCCGKSIPKAFKIFCDHHWEAKSFKAFTHAEASKSEHHSLRDLVHLNQPSNLVLKKHSQFYTLVEGWYIL